METKRQENDEDCVGETRPRNRGVHNADELAECNFVSRGKQSHWRHLASDMYITSELLDRWR